jgi:hypothetical protein
MQTEGSYLSPNSCRWPSAFSRDVSKAATRLAIPSLPATRSHRPRHHLQSHHKVDVQTLAETHHLQTSISATYTHPGQTTRSHGLECVSASHAYHTNPSARCPTLRVHVRCRSNRAALVRERTRGASWCRKSLSRFACTSYPCCWRCWMSSSGCWCGGLVLRLVSGGWRSCGGCCVRSVLMGVRRGLKHEDCTGREPSLVDL